MNKTYLPVTEYLLHRPPMLLVDELVQVENQHIICSVQVRADSPFCDGTQVPVWIGLEYMAQTVGVLAGYQAKEAGLDIQVGFLVGCRSYRANTGHFSVGDVLHIHATQSLVGDSKIIAMDCAVKCNEVPLAEAVLLVYQPEDLDVYLASLDEGHEANHVS